ncbi:MAG: ribonuclease R [Bacteroidales bacterium]|nr:ribonuclease R [Bacteroidales bacterium]
MSGKNKSNRKKPGQNISDLTKSIISLFNDSPRQAFNYKQISRQLHIKEQARRKIILKALQNLKRSGDIQEIYPGKYKLKSTGMIMSGKVEMSSGGYGYVMSDSVSEPVFISQDNLHHALNGDTVKIYLFAAKKSRGPEGEVIEIIERARDTFVGVVEVSSRFAFLSPDNRKMPYDIFIPIEKLKGARDGQKAIARIVEWPRQAKNPFGEIIEVLGDQGDNETEMHAILADFGLPYRFSKETTRAAESISDAIAETDISNRKDYRKIPTFTIDPEDAKDYDDALSLQKLHNGNWEVGVHIADVTYYVKPGSLLDSEAQERATSVYLVDRTVPMLPERLSNHICSLRPKEDKLCFSAVFELNDEAEICNEWFGKTIINSDRRFSYQEAQKIIDTGEGDMKDEIRTLHGLAQKLRNERFKRGSISFEREEVKFEIDEKGHPQRIYFREYDTANELIEEFMLMANKRVATLFGDIKNKQDRRTFVYRIHDKPNFEKLGKFASFISRFGHAIDLASGKKIAETLNRVLYDVKGSKEQDLVENLALRAMAKAEYSTNNIGHYGLGFKYYTHFTSPIRRYPDMLVHRLLNDYLNHQPPGNKKVLEKMCSHSSDMEQLAVDAERASVKYKQVEFMAERIGQIYDGIISGVTEWGIYVEIIENKCEGMIHIRNLLDDFYEYDEDNYCLTGRHTGRKFQLGDNVKIEIQRANLPRKQLDFALVI